MPLRNHQNTFTFEPIGHISSPLKDKFAIPRQSGLTQSLVSEVIVNKKWQPQYAFEGLNGYSHVWLIWIFNNNSQSEYKPKVHPPRLEGESIGVFASRSPHRPNPIGLSLVQLKQVAEDRLVVIGADLQDGTPILDIKPYLPEIESISQAQAGWAGAATRQKLKVEFSDEALEQIQVMERAQKQTNVIELIREIISLDPRPELYRGEKKDAGWQRHPRHAFRLFDGDIHFRMLNDMTALVYHVDVSINWTENHGSLRGE